MYHINAHIEIEKKPVTDVLRIMHNVAVGSMLTNNNYELSKMKLERTIFEMNQERLTRKI